MQLHGDEGKYVKVYLMYNKLEIISFQLLVLMIKKLQMPKMCGGDNIILKVVLGLKDH